MVHSVVQLTKNQGKSSRFVVALEGTLKITSSVVADSYGITMENLSVRHIFQSFQCVSFAEMWILVHGQV